MPYPDHDITTVQSRGRGGGWFAKCRRCSWRSRSRFDSEERAYLDGRYHQEAMKRQDDILKKPRPTS